MIKKTAVYLATGLALILLAGFLGLFLLSVPMADSIPVVGDYEPMIVQSGSMEPSIPVGGVVLVRKGIDPGDITEGDVITFRTPEQTGEPSYTTHRVTELSYETGDLTFSTKGDANEEPDSWTVPAASVIGREVLSVPYLGYFVRHVQSPYGFMLVVVVPALLVITLELRKIYLDIRERDLEEADACE